MEIWKDIPGYEGQYQASNAGRIKSLAWTQDHWQGGTSSYQERIVRGFVDTFGYVILSIGRNKRYKTVKVHRLVALTFVPNPNNLPEINHIDGNKQNNSIDNLEWCDRQHNIRHAFKMGLHSQIGGGHVRAKKVLNLATGIYYDTLKEAAATVGITGSYLGRLLSGIQENYHYKDFVYV